MVFFILVSANIAFTDMCHNEEKHKHETKSSDTKTHATQPKSINVNNKVCPVMGEKIDERTKVTYEYKGKVYNFCCAYCLGEFKKDPEKYIEKVKKEGN